jgi:hypothetical protein
MHVMDVRLLRARNCPNVRVYPGREEEKIKMKGRRGALGKRSGVRPPRRGKRFGVGGGK